MEGELVQAWGEVMHKQTGVHAAVRVGDWVWAVFQLQEQW